MGQIKLNVKGLSYSQTQTGAYALVLGEEHGDRRLPIIIGGFEAQSIAIALEKDMDPPRPLTHDLFKSFADRFSIGLKQVIIHKLQDGVFYSVLVCEQDGQEQSLDARTSDAVSLAIRFNAPIYTYEEILEKAGVILTEGESPKKETEEDQSELKEEKIAPKKKSSAKEGLLSTLSLEALNKELQKAVANEDYEKAAKIRDEIDRR